MSASQPIEPTEEAPSAQRPGHARRPPLAEIDTWELWQAWKRGDRGVARPWVGLLVGFCLVLAGMYSFFFFSTRVSNDAIAQVVLTIVLVAFLFSLWKRISPRRDFAFMLVALMLAVSGGAFVLWLAMYRLSGWSLLVAVGGTVLLGLVGLVVGWLSLNAIGGRET